MKIDSYPGLPILTKRESQESNIQDVRLTLIPPSRRHSICSYGAALEPKGSIFIEVFCHKMTGDKSLSSIAQSHWHLSHTRRPLSRLSRPQEETPVNIFIPLIERYGNCMWNKPISLNFETTNHSVAAADELRWDDQFQNSCNLLIRGSERLVTSEIALCRDGVGIQQL